MAFLIDEAVEGHYVGEMTMAPARKDERDNGEREGEKVVPYSSASFCVSMTAATGMPKFDTGPQKSIRCKANRLALRSRSIVQLRRAALPSPQFASREEEDGDSEEQAPFPPWHRSRRSSRVSW